MDFPWKNKYKQVCQNFVNYVIIAVGVQIYASHAITYMAYSSSNYTVECSRHVPTILSYSTILLFPLVLSKGSCRLVLFWLFWWCIYINIFSIRPFSQKNNAAYFIDSSNFCNSTNNTAPSSDPISVYRCFWCIYFRYLEQCRKRHSWLIPILELALHP